MAITVRLSAEEEAALAAEAEAEGIAIEDAARRAITTHLDNVAEHRARVLDAGARIMSTHADALRRLGRVTEHLDLEDVLGLARLLFGDPPPVRELGMLRSAVAQPQASAFGEDAYPDLWAKAAALLRSILKNHPLVDGNKRLGWLATATFLDINGVAVEQVPNDTVYDLVIRVAAGHHQVEEIAALLRTALGR